MANPILRLTNNKALDAAAVFIGQKMPEFGKQLGKTHPALNDNILNRITKEVLPKIAQVKDLDPATAKKFAKLVWDKIYALHLWADVAKGIIGPPLKAIARSRL